MLRFPWYSWDLRWVTLKDLTLSLNVCTETRLWCILWCHWAHVCIIIMPLDPKDTPQLSQDDIILLFVLLEIHEKPLSWMCFWLWESGEKTEIPQNNKVVLCDLPLIMEVWLFFFSFFTPSLILEAHGEFCLPLPTTALWWTSQTDQEHM